MRSSRDDSAFVRGRRLAADTASGARAAELRAALPDVASAECLLSSSNNGCSGLESSSPATPSGEGPSRRLVAQPGERSESL